MALSTTSLRNRIRSKVEAATGVPLPELTVDVWTAVAEAIVEELTAAAVVTVTTTCPAGGGSGTGTVA